jgi:hypothetical protein
MFYDDANDERTLDDVFEQILEDRDIINELGTGSLASDAAK